MAAAFVTTLSEGPTALAGLRRSLTAWLDLAGSSSDVRDSILLATHEAAANAMVHGEAERPVTVSASENEDGGFTVDVTNHGRWKERQPGHNGRGFPMMVQLMPEVGVRTSVRMRSA
jgi:anti-sigma regulatory factor (Ser/Thr protein kinase)